MKPKFVKVMYWIGGILFVVFVIPNITNFKERRAFSDERRLEKSLSVYHIDTLGDSASVVPGEYYRRRAFSTLFLGKKYRQVWTTPVTVKVFDYKTTQGGLKPFEFGGGDQTISIKLNDTQERKWALRSVNKDQQYVLPKFFRITFMRFLVRDQLASANPYGHLVVPVLANAMGLHHASPKLFLVPYDDQYGKYNERMAGRLAYLEESLNSSWKHRERFGSPKDILDTDEMLHIHSKEKIPVDSALYLKTRLFDMLISDWDRHPGNWEWALTVEASQKIFEPIPKDRDNAFFQFDEGLFSHITSLFMPKFQSYRKKYGKVSGLMRQSQELDKKILSTVDKKEFQRAAGEIQEALSDKKITTAFEQYPPLIYNQVGKEHEEILKARLVQLPDVANRFYDLIHKK